MATELASLQGQMTLGMSESERLAFEREQEARVAAFEREQDARVAAAVAAERHLLAQSTPAAAPAPLPPKMSLKRAPAPAPAPTPTPPAATSYAEELPVEEPVYVDPIVAEALRRCVSGPLLTRVEQFEPHTHRLTHCSALPNREEEHRAAILAEELLAERNFREYTSAREHGSGSDRGLVVPVGTSWGGAQHRQSAEPRVQEGTPPREGGARYGDSDGYEVVRVRAVTAQGIRSRQLSGGLSGGRPSRARPLPVSPDRGASASVRAARLRAQTSADSTTLLSAMRQDLSSKSR